MPCWPSAPRLTTTAVISLDSALLGPCPRVARFRLVVNSRTAAGCVFSSRRHKAVFRACPVHVLLHILLSVTTANCRMPVSRVHVLVKVHWPYPNIGLSHDASVLGFLHPAWVSKQPVNQAVVSVQSREAGHWETPKPLHLVQSLDKSVATLPCMSFWCMSAGVVMQRLQAAGVRNIILTSGTLSPLAATAEELAVPMPIRLENPHVVQPQQVRRPLPFVLCVHGPPGSSLPPAGQPAGNSQWRRASVAEARGRLSACCVTTVTMCPSRLCSLNLSNCAAHDSGRSALLSPTQRGRPVSNHSEGPERERISRLSPGKPDTAIRSSGDSTGTATLTLHAFQSVHTGARPGYPCSTA